MKAGIELEKKSQASAAYKVYDDLFWTHEKVDEYVPIALVRAAMACGKHSELRSKVEKMGKEGRVTTLYKKHMVLGLLDFLPYDASNYDPSKRTASMTGHFIRARSSQPLALTPRLYATMSNAGEIGSQREGYQDLIKRFPKIEGLKAYYALSLWNGVLLDDRASQAEKDRVARKPESALAVIKPFLERESQPSWSWYVATLCHHVLSNKELAEKFAHKYLDIRSSEPTIQRWQKNLQKLGYTKP